MIPELSFDGRSLANRVLIGVGEQTINVSLTEHATARHRTGPTCPYCSGVQPKR
jgi:hypothetical protein